MEVRGGLTDLYGLLRPFMSSLTEYPSSKRYQTTICEIKITSHHSWHATDQKDMNHNQRGLPFITVQATDGLHHPTTTFWVIIINSNGNQSKDSDQCSYQHAPMDINCCITHYSEAVTRNHETLPACSQILLDDKEI